MKITDIIFKHDSEHLASVLGFTDKQAFLDFTENLARFILHNGIMGTYKKTECLEMFLQSEDIEKKYSITLTPSVCIAIGLSFAKALDHVQKFMNEKEVKDLLMSSQTPEEEHDRISSPEKAIEHIKEHHFEEIKDMIQKQIGIVITKDMIKIPEGMSATDILQGENPIGMIQIDATKAKELQANAPLKRGLKAD